MNLVRELELQLCSGEVLRIGLCGLSREVPAMLILVWFAKAAAISLLQVKRGITFSGSVER